MLEPVQSSQLSKLLKLKAIRGVCKVMEVDCYLIAFEQYYAIGWRLKITFDSVWWRFKI